MSVEAVANCLTWHTHCFDFEGYTSTSRRKNGRSQPSVDYNIPNKMTIHCYLIHSTQNFSPNILEWQNKC
ncbi:DNA glycosylase superfamily protein [Prunus dulcis]|uniref:DNA glycosylase superfamily protein n=1 Tax=Prunus dulcis TaxID=3755 RepID=A0A5H2Y7J8_PRUDU|nr:DNA glycosylase superfamily protein [Prunus dulcis]